MYASNGTGALSTNYLNTRNFSSTARLESRLKSTLMTLPDSLSSIANLTSATAVPEGSTENSYETFYNVAKEATGLYLFPIFCIIGIIGNLLTFIVFINFKPRSSTNIYLTALAVSDTIKLICDFFYFICVFLEKIDHHEASTKVYTALYPYAHYVLNFALCNTAWLTVSVAVERFIYMKWPERARTICTITRASITCSVVWICAMLITIPCGMRYTRVEGENHSITINVTELWRDENFRDPYLWLQTIVRSIIPLVILIFVNTWIIRALSRATKHYYQRPLACKNRVTVMLVAIIISFLICITPDAIMSSVFDYGYTDASFFVKGIREITDLLLCINSAINFFLYFGFNKVFRHNFAKVFCKNYYWEHLAMKDEGIT